ncbi:unnamed protein product, partial [Durusdinium trenchii]
FFFNRKTEESLFNDPRHITYHSLYTRIRFVNMMKEKLPLLALAPRATDPIVNISELERQQKAAEAKALASVTRMQAAVRVMLARRKARLLQAKRCLNRVPHDMKGKLRLTVRTAVPGTNQTECVLRVTSSYRRNRAASKIQARIRGFLARRRYRPMRDHRRYLIQNTIRIQRAIRRWLSTLADVKAARQARVQAVIRMQCWARSIAARKLYAEKLGAKATFVKLKQVVIHIQCHVRQWLAKRRVREIRRVKYTPSVRMIQRQMKVFKAKAELMQHLRNHEPVDLIFHLTSGQKGSKILPFVWKLGMLPVGEDGKVINPEAFRDQKRLEKMRRQAKVYRKQKEVEDDFDEEPPKSIDLFSKVGLESLSVAAASVIQQTFHATQSGKKCRRAFALIRDVLDTAVEAAADLVAVRAAAAPQIQRVFRGWRVRRSNILEKKRHAYFVKKLEQIETVQSFMHRFACQVSLRDFCRESRVFMAASKIQAHVRGMLTRNYVARLAEEAEWPLKGWFEYTGMGRDCVQLNVKFLLNPSFDAFRHFRKYGKQQTLLQRLQEMQAEIDSCLRMYLGPAEYAAMEARKAAGSAAQRAKAEAEREQEEVNAMAAADQESFAIEKTVRAEEAAVRREEEEKLRAEEEERLRAEEEERLRAEEEERLRAEAEAQRAEEDANISTVSQALANFTYAAQALLGEEPAPVEEVEPAAQQEAAVSREAAEEVQRPAEDQEPAPVEKAEEPAAQQEAAASRYAEEVQRPAEDQEPAPVEKAEEPAAQQEAAASRYAEEVQRPAEDQAPVIATVVSKEPAPAEKVEEPAAQQEAAASRYAEEVQRPAEDQVEEQLELRLDEAHDGIELSRGEESQQTLQRK